MAASSPGHARRVLIVDAEGNPFNKPTLKCIIDLLLEEGCSIDLRLPISPAPVPFVAGVRFLPFGSLTRKVKTAIFGRLCSWWLGVLSVAVENFFVYASYDFVIGIDRQGLIEASVLHQLIGAPVVFVSFEIMFESETSARYKALERRAAKSVSLWVVQDEARAEQLQAENGLPPERRVLLPLASAGPGAMQEPRLRDLLLIPEGKHVAIVIGSVSEWSMIGRILRSVAGWPDDWVLLVHERYGRTSAILAPELNAMESLVRQRVYISDAATAMVDDMGSVLAGVSAGLAFYEPDYKTVYSGRNLKHLGMASGKISTYLRYGIPVILNDMGLYAEDARRFQFGRVAESPEAIRDHLDFCLEERYQENARKYFAEKLDFNNFREHAWARLRSLFSDTGKNQDG